MFNPVQYHFHCHNEVYLKPNKIPSLLCTAIWSQKMSLLCAILRVIDDPGVSQRREEFPFFSVSWYCDH